MVGNVFSKKYIPLEWLKINEKPQTLIVQIVQFRNLVDYIKLGKQLFYQEKNGTFSLTLNDVLLE